MRTATRRVARLLSIGVMAVLPACFSDGGGAPSPTTSAPAAPVAANPSPVAPVAANPSPVARLTLENGNVISFYEIGGRSLVTEEGAVDNVPALNSRVNAEKTLPVDVWKTLAPDVPVPQALVDLELRLAARPPEPQSTSPLAVKTTKPHNEVSTGLSAESLLPQSEDGLLATPNGCSNGCCDYDWLATFSQCQHSTYDYAWFLYNYTWTYANVSDISYVSAMVCAATGSSTWSMSVSGQGGTWNIAEAHYLTWAWTECGWPWCGGDMTSSVNSSTNQHLHTYCGRLSYD